MQRFDRPPTADTFPAWIRLGVGRQPLGICIALLASSWLYLAVWIAPFLLPVSIFAGGAYAQFAWGWSLPLVFLALPLFVAFGVIVVVLFLALALLLSVPFMIQGAIWAACIFAVTRWLEPWSLRHLRGYRRMSRRERNRLARRAPAAGAPEWQTTDAVGELLPADGGLLVTAARGMNPPLTHVPALLVDQGKVAGAWTHLGTIVVTRGLLDFDDAQITGVLAHELEHWRRGDVVGMRLVWACAFPLAIGANLMARAKASIWSPAIIYAAFLLLACWPAELIVRFLLAPVIFQAGRAQEYGADAAAAHSFRNGLYAALDEMMDFESARTGWEAIATASHPPIELRLEKLERPDDTYVPAPLPALVRVGVPSFLALGLVLSIPLLSAAGAAASSLIPLSAPANQPVYVLPTADVSLPTPTPTPLPTPSPTPLPTLVGASMPPSSAYPDHDTPFARASAALQEAWRPYGVTLIPSRHIFDAMPTPQVVNETGGQFSDAKVQRWALADLRFNALLGWSELHRQMALRQRLAAPNMLPSSATDALQAGASVSEGDCNLYPTRIAVAPIDHETADFLALASSPAGNDRYMTIEDYTGGCQVTARYPDGHSDVLYNGSPGQHRVLHAVHMLRDPVLGPYLYTDGGGSCDSLFAPSGPCTTS